MGISSSSMYEVFGDKRGIFLLALARFCQIERQRIAQMAQAAATPQAFIEQLFASVEDVTQPQPQTQGSLAFNAMVEFGTLDPDVTPLLLDHYFGIVAIIAGVLEQGQATGSVTSQAPALDLAHTILTTLQGVATVKGVKPDFAHVHAITQIILHLLAPQR
jgi:TetR/AcrR family transcriptional repressor of nem operon